MDEVEYGDVLSLLAKNDTNFDLKPGTKLKRIKNLLNCQRFGICQLQRSKLFLKEPFCNFTALSSSSTYTPDKGPLTNFCQKIPKQKIDQICKSKSIVTTKVIRLKSLKYIWELLEEDENVYIIYLSRDPRGTVNSRFDIPNNEWSDKRRALGQVCSRYESNLEFLRGKNGSSELDRFRLLRYRVGFLDRCVN